jgi:hypothetical protein
MDEKIVPYLIHDGSMSGFTVVVDVDTAATLRTGVAADLELL